MCTRISTVCKLACWSSFQQCLQAQLSAAVCVYVGWGIGRLPCNLWNNEDDSTKPTRLVVQVTYDKLLAEVPKYKLITPSVLSDRLRVRVLAKLAVCSCNKECA